MKFQNWWFGDPKEPCEKQSHSPLFWEIYRRVQWFLAYLIAYVNMYTYGWTGITSLWYTPFIWGSEMAETEHVCWRIQGVSCGMKCRNMYIIYIPRNQLIQNTMEGQPPKKQVRSGLGIQIYIYISCHSPSMRNVGHLFGHFQRRKNLRIGNNSWHEPWYPCWLLGLVLWVIHHHYPMVKVHGTVPKRWVNTGVI